jgi:hypothetical protein
MASVSLAGRALFDFGYPLFRDEIAVRRFPQSLGRTKNVPLCQVILMLPQANKWIMLHPNNNRQKILARAGDADHLQGIQRPA